jgi:beta-glucanase (GH16 family)
MRKIYLAFICLLVSSAAFSFDVTFRIDMHNSTGFTTPEVNGTFNNWCGSCAAMTDADQDGIWEVTIALNAGNYEYKYSFDNWAGQEDLIPGTPCTVTAGQYTNRVLNVNSNEVLDLVCWGQCSTCIPQNTTDWTLIWADEFDGTALNTDNWTPEIGSGGWGNNESQYYTGNSTNVSVYGGKLYITALEEQIADADYSSARLITRDKFEFQYGKLEARLQLPTGQGIWPAFWLLGANITEVGWPLCGEIDVMEHVNNEPVTHGTTHWLNNNHVYKGTSFPVETDDFHTYGIIWDETHILFSVDDNIYYDYVFAENTNSSASFHQPFFLLLNVAVGGNWPGYPDNSTEFPATMTVDYVRMYQEDGVSTQDIEVAANLSVYPNPCEDFVVVSNTSNEGFTSYEILNAVGEVVESGSMTQGDVRISTAQFASGIYTVRCKSARGLRTAQVVRK